MCFTEAEFCAGLQMLLLCASNEIAVKKMVLLRNGRLDKFWTNFGQMSKFCSIFVQGLSKFCQCPIFVKLIEILLSFVKHLSRTCPNILIFVQDLSTEYFLHLSFLYWTKICQIFVQVLSMKYMCIGSKTAVQLLSNVQALSSFCPIFVQVVSMSKMDKYWRNFQDNT